MGLALVIRDILSGRRDRPILGVPRFPKWWTLLSGVVIFVFLLFILCYSFFPFFLYPRLLLVISLSSSVDSGNRLCSHVFLDMHYWLQKRKVNSNEEVRFCIYCSALKLVAINLKQGRTQMSIPFFFFQKSQVCSTKISPR